MTDATGPNGISIALGRIEGKLDALDERLDRQDAQLDLVRSHCEQMGQSIAGCQGAAARREQRISAMEKQVRGLEVTGVVQITGQRVRWRTLATLGAVIVSLVSATAAISGLRGCGAGAARHDASVHAAKKGR